MGNISLRGQRILVVEDRPVLAQRLTRILKSAGADVVGPATTLAAAERLAANERLSAALLDVRLDDDARVWPVARALAGKGVPFLFCTSHADELERSEWSERPVIGKGAKPEEMVGALTHLVR
jgi:DNA-binding response OmpR family regulator